MFTLKYITIDQEKAVVARARHTAEAFVKTWKRPIELHSSGVGLDWEHIAWETDVEALQEEADLKSVNRVTAMEAWSLYQYALIRHSRALLPHLR